MRQTIFSIRIIFIYQIVFIVKPAHAEHFQVCVSQDSAILTRFLRFPQQASTPLWVHFIKFRSVVLAQLCTQDL